MSAIIPGYEYDIFISYRQKDNKGDRWVSEFVDALKIELESTFKEEISVYFDINPHDGLLETHDVNASLKEKLKCLVFIPIVSQTYCDSKSFAWHHEFVAFNKMAKEDQFGRDIKLSNGNVSSRILPVKIHDLDQADKSLLENELGSVLRSVEFIFKSQGVNRPLKPDDSRTENLNHSYYRDQINKVANAVKEIINVLKYRDEDHQDLTIKRTSSAAGKISSRLKQTILWMLLVFVIAITGYFLIPTFSKGSGDIIDKSIAVLPFVNMSNDPEQEYFSDGMMQEILNHIFLIGGIKIPSSTTTMRFKGSKLSIKEIAQKLDVTYVLEGNVSKSGERVRIIVRLINGKNERLLWTQDYKRAMTATDLMDIQSDVAQQVAENMKIVINPDVKRKIESKPTLNTESYTLYLQAVTDFLPFDQAKSKLEQAISLDPAYSDAYAQLAYYWLHQGGYKGKVGREKVLEKAEPLLDKALELNQNSFAAHCIKAILRLYYYWDFESVEKDIMGFDLASLSNSNLEYFISDYLIASGKFYEALTFNENALNHNNKADNWVDLALSYNYNNQPEKAFTTISTAREIFPNNDYVFITQLQLLIYQGQYDMAIGLFEKNIPESDFKKLIPMRLALIGIAYYKTGEKSKSKEFLDELLNKSRESPVGSPSFYTAALYASIEEKEKAFQLLETAFSDHEVEMYWLNVDPFFKPLHGDPRFENILRKIGFTK